MKLKALNRTFALGIDLGGTATKVGLFTPAGNLVERVDFDTCKDGPAAIAAESERHIRALLERNGANPNSVTAIGVAVAGVVGATGRMSLCVNVDLDLTTFKDMLSALMPNASIAAINDANAAALGERWQGELRDCQDFVFVTLGTGIGAGIVAAGHLVRGRSGAAGEIGHLNVNPHEDGTCNCGGHGCLEQYSSGSGLLRMVGNSLAAGQHSTLEGPSPYGAKEVFDAAASGDKVAQAAVSTFTDCLARGLALVACTLDPQVIMLGGGLSGSASVYLDALRESYAKQAFPACRSIPLECASLGNSAGIYGAAYHAMRCANQVVPALGDLV